MVISITLFSFLSFAEYESYREIIKTDEDGKAALELAEKIRCILSFERSFLDLYLHEFV